MSKNNEIGFSIGLSNKETNEKLQDQKITFGGKDRILLGVQEDGSSLASIEFLNDEVQVLVFDPKKLDLNLGHDILYLEDGNNAYKISGVEIDGENNIKISVTSCTGAKWTSVHFAANEIAIKSKDKQNKTIATETLDMRLPENIFSLATKNNSILTLKHLPSQFMSVMDSLEDVQTLEITHKGKPIQFAKVENKENPNKPFIYVVNGTKMKQHFLEDFYIYNPEQENQKGFVGIKTTKNSTRAYGLNNIEKSNIDKILEFIAPQNNEKQITMLTKQQYKEQILKAKTIRKGQDKTKFTAGFVKEEIKSETKGSEDEKAAKKAKQAQDEAGVAAGATNENEQGDEDSTTIKVVDDENEDAPFTVGGNKNNEETKSTTTNETTNTNTNTNTNAENDKAQAQQTDKGQPAPAAKDNAKKTETVDLSDLAKMVGIGLFLFGLFSGIGGILLSILSVGIGTTTLTYTGKLKKIELPEGEKKLKEGKEKAKKEGKIKEVNVKKKSSAKEEISGIEDLKEKGLISDDLAKDITQIIKSFEHTKGMSEKVKEYFEKYIETIQDAVLMLDAEAKDLKIRHKYDSLAETEAKVEKLNKGLEQLNSFKQIFDRQQDNLAEELNVYFQTFEKYQTMKARKFELEENKVTERRDELKERLRELNQEFKDLESKGDKLSLKEKERMKIVETLIFGLGEAHVGKYYDEALELENITKELDYLEETFVNKVVIENLKEATLTKTKKLFNKFNDVAKQLEEVDKRYTKMDKKFKKLEDKVNSGPEL